MMTPSDYARSYAFAFHRSPATICSDGVRTIVCFDCPLDPDRALASHAPVYRLVVSRFEKFSVINPMPESSLERPCFDGDEVAIAVKHLGGRATMTLIGDSGRLPVTIAHSPIVCMFGPLTTSPPDTSP